jgi:hypothetical protein
MNADCSPAREERSSPNEVPANLDAPCKAPQADLALLELENQFLALLSEVSAVERKHGRAIGAAPRQHRKSVQSDEATTTRRIEAVLRRLAPIEQAIMATPARTITGLGIKARHAAYAVSEYWDAPIEQIDWEARTVRLLIEAVCKAAGVSLRFVDKGNL